MDLFAQFNNYCERTDFSYWSEPVNAITNAAFLIAAAVVWAVLGGKKDRPARILVGILVLIGIGSYLFHTHATGWALMADTTPILAFILVYIYFATTLLLGLPWWAGAAAVVLYFPFTWGIVSFTRDTVGGLNGSVTYVSVPILILIYAAILAFRDRSAARGLAIGAGILILSLFFRTIDRSICPAFPLGTHFLWHILNGIMLGWMILVLHWHGAWSYRER